MKDFHDIVKRIRDLGRPLAEPVVATVVNTIGSSYRRPGARLLLEKDGFLTGVLSGGCLEADLIERAKRVRANGRSELITYDTSSPHEIVDGLGIGCNGKVQVLLEPWSVGAESLTFAGDVLETDRCCVIATIFHVRGFPDVVWGSRVLVDDRSITDRSVAHEGLRREITAKARALLASGSTTVESLQLGVEVADVLFEVIAPRRSLVILGAGPGSASLARLAKELGWRVTLADHREKASYAHDFACADRRISGDYASIRTSLELSNSTAVVVMSHSFAADLEYLKIAIPSPVRYIGVLGSRGRALELLKALSGEGLSASVHHDDRFYNPIGLDIGADGPEEIALAILCEIRAVWAGRSGGFLRDRKGPIHDRPATDGPH